MQLKISHLVFLLICQCSRNSKNVYVQFQLIESETGNPISSVLVLVSFRSVGLPLTKVDQIGHFYSDENGIAVFSFQTTANKVCFLFHKKIEGSNLYYGLDGDVNSFECLSIEGENEKISRKVFFKKYRTPDPE